jgi:GT2 family glycosyltransferase
MAKIIMASYVTETNNRLDYAIETIYSLTESVDFSKHELFISDNGSRQGMLDYYKWFRARWNHLFPRENLTISLNGKNLGTAEAVNLGIKERKPDQRIIKIDSDVTIGRIGWVEEMEECFDRCPNLGILGLKRTDVMQKSDHESPNYRTELVSAPHEVGQSWIILELCEDIIGTCTMFSPKLLDKAGYLLQPGNYGWEDCLMSLRSRGLGFANAFLPSIPIVHLDNGAGDYIQEKQVEAGRTMAQFSEISEAYKSGKKDFYYNPFV